MPAGPPPTTQQPVSTIVDAILILAPSISLVIFDAELAGIDHRTDSMNLIQTWPITPPAQRVRLPHQPKQSIILGIEGDSGLCKRMTNLLLRDLRGQAYSRIRQIYGFRRSSAAVQIAGCRSLQSSPRTNNGTQTRKESKHMGHGLIAWIFIGIVAGWLTGKLMKGSGFGMIMDMIVGLVGALIGGFLSSHLGFGGVGQHGLIMSILIAVVGAIVLTLIIRLISGNRSANL
jgi:uncharacterized membrane protein YeaQ/YmgE (transglycosylase-associated protein family)